jgi:hypothetical protein
MRAFVVIRQLIANPILFCPFLFSRQRKGSLASILHGYSKCYFHQSPSYVVFSFHLLFTTKLRKM